MGGAMDGAIYAATVMAERAAMAGRQPGSKKRFVAICRGQVVLYGTRARVERLAVGFPGAAVVEAPNVGI